MDLVQQEMTRMGQQARQAARQLARASGAAKNAALNAMTDGLIRNTLHLQRENEKDLLAGREKGLSAAMLDRLTLTNARIQGMAEGIAQVAALEDPVGEIIGMKPRPNGLMIGRMRVPLGVIGIIYESRPNVTADAAALSVKSGNAVILRGGSEAIHSNRAIAAILAEGLEMAQLPRSAVQLVQTPDRAAVGALLSMNQHVDVIIPRGGKGLIERIIAESHIPVIKHLHGICHTYIDQDADVDMAIKLTLNGKMQRTGVCNATETLLVHAAMADTCLPPIGQTLKEAGCVMRCCPETLKRLAPLGGIPATDEDWDTEYLDAILSIRVVASMDEAMDHIERHGSQHTDTIVTRDHARAMRFLREVDSSSVMVNASTRFSDGFEYGLGAEMGISTDRLHVRGPVGLEGLTTLKYIVLGAGQTRG
ncbi:MAG: glutamate-5-semialdehyde dehydrogenase [Magnetococcales bacterium]|nr:glutamate-5-semialdehyde dehydrogenase [Magnetococcales bacterium]MBF0149199.1 glutamate-5-semialdehyde dehydrogenase [Magnetococcales bacterium]MBF0632513.1 glutamate-5-semialdehyde dehydrogenase [Magnetococcales bacterium]